MHTQPSWSRKRVVTIKLFLDCAKSAVSTFEQVNIFYDTTLFHWLVSNTCITERYFVQNRDCYITQPRLLTWHNQESAQTFPCERDHKSRFSTVLLFPFWVNIINVVGLETRLLLIGQWTTLLVFLKHTCIVITLISIARWSVVRDPYLLVWYFWVAHYSVPGVRQ